MFDSLYRNYGRLYGITQRQGNFSTKQKARGTLLYISFQNDLRNLDLSLEQLGQLGLLGLCWRKPIPSIGYVGQNLFPA